MPKAGFLPSDYSFSEAGAGFQVAYNTAESSIPIKLADETQLVNLRYFFHVLVKYKWLEPLIKKLIKLPPNRIFQLIYIFPVVNLDIKYRRSFRGKIRSALILAKVLIKGI